MSYHHVEELWSGGLYKVCGALRTLATLVTVTVSDRAAIDPSVFTIMEKAPTRAFSWLKAPNLRHYAKQVSNL